MSEDVFESELPTFTKDSRIWPRSSGLNGRYFYLLNHFASHQISLLWHKIIPDVNIISRLSIRTLNYIVFISVHITGCLLRDALLMSQSKVSLVLLDGSYYVMIFVCLHFPPASYPHTDKLEHKFYESKGVHFAHCRMYHWESAQHTAGSSRNSSGGWVGGCVDNNLGIIIIRPYINI